MKNIYLFFSLHKLNYELFNREDNGETMKNKKTRVNQVEKKTFNLTILHGSRQRYPDNPGAAKLEAFPNPRPKREYWIHIDCPEFTTLCPITGQPDFAVITIDYVPDKLCIESKALKFYLYSYRSIGAFHEESVNRIMDDIVKACHPRQLKVTGKFNPRGGIAITVCAEYP